ncbi:hypothetical protein M409DRAFT_55288 [Zasmidium cellare ATCC 36951]|uniref:Uncharacterized protein n=1 Tax=Zasmidium cellare ATCC 36951 TaxID=1080233 RepID=A0A6A6CI99_ZASCE|nr:uncharacterized protein M409DRAFT_55288 [Zasmidium cellare ATCC 36951]KAF2165920.1 hypothetical protein M409DRAFT_55288 [Zasmidium cellare ATCC 36951]
MLSLLVSSHEIPSPGNAVDLKDEAGIITNHGLGTVYHVCRRSQPHLTSAVRHIPTLFIPKHRAPRPDPVISLPASHSFHPPLPIPPPPHPPLHHRRTDAQAKRRTNTLLLSTLALGTSWAAVRWRQEADRRRNANTYHVEPHRSGGGV